MISLPFTIFVLVAFWKVFVKAGQPGWAALIPLYNVVILFKMAGKEWWYIFLLLVPIYNIVIIVQMWHAISKAFGKRTGFTVGLVLLNAIFISILAFDSSVYDPQGVQNPDAPLDQL